MINTEKVSQEVVNVEEEGKIVEKGLVKEAIRKRDEGVDHAIEKS